MLSSCLTKYHNTSLYLLKRTVCFRVKVMDVLPLLSCTRFTAATVHVSFKTRIMQLVLKILCSVRSRRLLNYISTRIWVVETELALEVATMCSLSCGFCWPLEAQCPIRSQSASISQSTWTLAIPHGVHQRSFGSAHVRMPCTYCPLQAGCMVMPFATAYPEVHAIVRFSPFLGIERQEQIGSLLELTQASASHKLMTVQSSLDESSATSVLTMLRAYLSLDFQRLQTLPWRASVCNFLEALNFYHANRSMYHGPGYRDFFDVTLIIQSPLSLKASIRFHCIIYEMYRVQPAACYYHRVLT